MSAWVVTQSCLTLCNPMDYSLPGFSVHGISQARILEWIAISFSRGSLWPRDWACVSCIGRQVLYPESLGKPKIYNTVFINSQHTVYYIFSIYFINRNCTFWPPSPISNTLFYSQENWGLDWFVYTPRICNSVEKKMALLNLVALMWSEFPGSFESLCMWLHVQFHLYKSS